MRVRVFDAAVAAPAWHLVVVEAFVARSLARAGSLLVLATTLVTPIRTSMTLVLSFAIDVTSLVMRSRKLARHVATPTIRPRSFLTRILRFVWHTASDRACVKSLAR